MGLAPTPGVGARAEAAEAAKLTFTITIRGESLRFAPNNMPLSERLLLRKATGGLSLESFWNGEAAIGIDSVMILWWLARRASGEWQLTLTKAEEQWPQDLRDDEIQVEVDDPHANEEIGDPES